MMRAMFTLEEFRTFCMRFDEANHFDFEESDMMISGEADAVYETMCRDSSNYKSHVTLMLKKGDITWDVHYGFEEAYEELEGLYKELIAEQLKGDGVLLLHVDDYHEISRRYCPMCGNKAAEPTGDSFHLDGERFEEQNEYEYEGRVDRYQCLACPADFYLAEDTK